MVPRFLMALLGSVMLAMAADSAWSVSRLVGANYPLLAQQAQIQGTVEVTCRVDAGGSVVECTAPSGHALLRDAALVSARKWRWRRTQEGDSGDNTETVRYEFQLVGPAVRSRPKVEFSFEFPNIARVVSEIPCADHASCTPEETERDRERSRRSKSAIPDGARFP